jgi:hypothetical protein
VAVAAPGQGATRIEGEYQLQLDIRKQDRLYEWDFDSNNDDSWGLVQFRIHSEPAPGVEAFLKFEEDWNRGGNSAPRPEFQYRESHVRFRKEKNGRGVDLILFSRQDRFWVENHLIEVVRPWAANDGGNAQGFRADLFGYGGWNLAYIHSDFSSQSNPSTNPEDPADPVGTDDAHVFRARREFLGGALRTGVTWNRKVEAEDRLGEAGHFEVFAGDLRYTWGTTDLLVEFARSQNRDAGSELERGEFRWNRLNGSTWYRPHEWAPTDAVLKAELRSVTVGTPRLGYWSFAPYYWYAGRAYTNPLGDSLSDEQGLWLNSWYLLPERAVTLTVNHGRWKRSVFENKNMTELYAEMYTEYVNGFASKLAWRRKRTHDHADPVATETTRNDDLFAEVQVESRLAWMRIQGKIKDYGTERRKDLASLETSVNLTGTVKLYNRFTFGNDPARLRDSFFAELQYRPRPGMEVFLSYGPWWIGDNPNPVDDGDLAGGAQNKDIVKFTLKGYF